MGVSMFLAMIVPFGLSPRLIYRDQSFLFQAGKAGIIHGRAF